MPSNGTSLTKSYTLLAIPESAYSEKASWKGSNKKVSKARNNKIHLATSEENDNFLQTVVHFGTVPTKTTWIGL